MDWSLSRLPPSGRWRLDRHGHRRPRVVGPCRLRRLSRAWADRAGRADPPLAWLRRPLSASLVAAVLAVISGCAAAPPAEGVRGRLPGKDWRVGLIFVGKPELDWPLRLKPGASGDLVPWVEGLALSLYPEAWLVGGPLWLPRAHAQEYAGCRTAVKAAGDRVAVRFQQLADWSVVDALHARLALKVTGREHERAVLRSLLPAGIRVDDSAALLGAASSAGLQAVMIFEARTIEVRGTAAAGCGVSLFIRGRVRALLVPDGAAVSMPSLDLQVCRNSASIPLARFLVEDDALSLAMEAAVACVVRELLDWADRP